MQTCGADPRGVRVECRDGGGRTRLVGGTELGRMMGTDPNWALSVLEGLGGWEGARSAGGMDPQRKGWGRLQDWAEKTSSSSSSSSTSSISSGGRTPPPRPPNSPPQGPQEKPRFESSDEGAPPPRPIRASPRPRPSPRARTRAKPAPPQTPCKIGAGTLMGMCRVWGIPSTSLGRMGAMGGASAK